MGYKLHITRRTGAGRETTYEQFNNIFKPLFSLRNRERLAGVQGAAMSSLVAARRRRTLGTDAGLLDPKAWEMHSTIRVVGALS
jgi:hypothetical protein